MRTRMLSGSTKRRITFCLVAALIGVACLLWVRHRDKTREMHSVSQPPAAGEIAGWRFTVFQTRPGGLDCPSRNYGAGHRQLRFVHLQPGAIPGRDAGGPAGPPQRPDHPRPNPRARARAHPDLPGPLLARANRASPTTSSAPSDRRSRPSASAWDTSASATSSAATSSSTTA